jgi:hypothetical protein
MKGHEIWDHAAGWNEGAKLLLGEENGELGQPDEILGLENNTLKGMIKTKAKSYIQEAKDRITTENNLIDKLPNQRLNLRDLVLAQERSHAARPKVPYSKKIGELNRFTRGLSNDILKIKVGDRYLPIELLRIIDSYLRPDTIINELCHIPVDVLSNLPGPRTREFVRQQCTRVLPDQVVPETFAAQIDVLVRDFQRHCNRAQHNIQQAAAQQNGQALPAIQIQEEESKDQKEEHKEQ